MQFDFGKNWSSFSAHALTAQRVEMAKADFGRLLAHAGGVRDKSFVDIGFGQGLSLLAAAEAGAQVAGTDINPQCAEVLRQNRRYFPSVERMEFPVVIGSILDSEVVARMRQASPAGGVYDIVHSWGVLHHTGDMRLAIRNAASLVRPGGHLVLAIYNRHWSSRPWLAIKYAYCKSPEPIRKLMVWALAPVIFVAKWLVTRDDPRKQQRGMDFYYNVVDWVGGYPYEYASTDELARMVEPLGFQCVHVMASEVPTGCNEFVFRRT